MSMKKKQLSWLWLAGAVILLDQLVKWYINHYFVYGQPVPVLPFLNLTLAYNPGAAFGFLGMQGGWQVLLLTGVTILVVLGLCIWLWRLKPHEKYMAMALCLILGGAIGNLIDRVRLGYVIDYIDFYIRTWHYATFNLADVSICIGAFVLILQLLFEKS